MKVSCLTLSFILCLHILAVSQSDSTRLNNIAAKLQKQSVTHPVEKVYLQFNKPAYSMGDTIWFKGYVVVGTAHQPSVLSGVLYVDLIDGKDKIVKSLQLKNNNGISAGDIALDNNLQPGNFHIRAYTAWMRNAGPGYFFNTAIPVGDIQTNAVIVTPTYTISNTPNGEMMNTKLAYTDKFGRSYNDREVTCEVRADTNLLYRVKSITDASGILSFSFPGKTAPGQRVIINSHFKIAGGIVINKITPVNVPNENIDIQFFPEGGRLINDVRSKVAFKAIGTNGLGVNVKGTVTDNDNNEVAEFQSQHAGMGIFALTPQSGKTYTAKVTLADSLVVTIKLPDVADKGFVLAVNNADSANLNIRIATNAATLREKQNTAFYMVGQSGGTVYFTTVGKLDNSSFKITVPKNRFPTGITQFMLFSSENEPLNERAVFIQNNNDLLNLNLSSSKTTYASKGKVDMALSSVDKGGKPVAGSFSLTVYNDDITPVNEDDENTILSNILLTSDLQGYIEGPNYYFKPNNNRSGQTKADLDVLMLTQGYRRFEWKEVIADIYPPITFKPEKSLSLAGLLTSSSGKPIAKGTIKALSVANGIAVSTTADAQGQFNLTGLNLMDTATLVIQARKENKDKDVIITLDARPAPGVYKSMAGLTNGFTPPILNAGNPAKADTVAIAAAIRSSAFKFSQNNNLKEVTVKQRKNYGTENAPWMPVVTHSDNLNGPGHADQVLTYQEVGNCFDVTDCLTARIPGILKGTDKDHHPALLFALHKAQSLSAPPAIVFIVDGANIGSSLIKLEDIVNINNVMTIEVLKSSSYLNVYGTGASGGALIITTKKGTEGLYTGDFTDVAEGIITTRFKGFDKIRQFYVPKYTAKNVNLSDTRDAIYWNPDITTDDKGTLPIEFFNSDVKGTYRAVVEGIDNDGNIGRFVYRYKVE